MTHVQRTRTALLAVLLGAALLIAACGSSGGAKGDGVASLGSSSATTGSTGSPGSPGTKPSVLAYARCMRSHGIKDFPDPTSDGDLQLNADGPNSDLNMDDPRYKKADAACKSLLPQEKAPPAGLKAANLKYSQCMRAHGLKDFPDPKPDGTLQIQVRDPATSDLDPNNPRFQAADKACKHFQLNPGKGGNRGSTNHHK